MVAISPAVYTGCGSSAAVCDSEGGKLNGSPPWRPQLISLDVGGTIARTRGAGLAGILASKSRLSASLTRTIIRRCLHTAPSVTPELVRDLCQQLEIPASGLDDVMAARLEPVPFLNQALCDLADLAPVVTLSNVSAAEFNEGELRRITAPYVADFYPSCRTGFAKPDSRAFLYVAQTHGVPVSDLVHIGDSWECDVLGAMRAGAVPVWVRPVDCPDRGRTTPFVAGDLPAAVHLLRQLVRC